MTRAKKYANLGAIIIGFAAFVVAGWFLWNRMLTPVDLWIAAAMYLLSAIGVTVGYHRLLAHRAFETYAPVRYFFAILGSFAVQGPVIEWITDHRLHHSRADRDGDPHSPHVGYGPGWRGRFHGFLYAHMGWVMRTQGLASPSRFSRDLLNDRGLRLIDRMFPLLAIASLGIPFAAGYAVTGTLRGGFTAFLWAGPIRIAFVHHMSFSVNSLCHLFGRRRFAVEDHSRNVFWLALVTLGESWHHNHHAFPRSASHGLLWWELDLSALLIRTLGRLGLAWNIVQPSTAEQAARLAPGFDLSGHRVQLAGGTVAPRS